MSIANKIVVGLVGLTVMAVIFSAMLPIMGEVTSAETTFTNDGYFRMDKITDGNFTFLWEYDHPSTFTVNGNSTEFTNDTSLEISVVCSESFYLRIRANNLSFIYNGPGGNMVADATGEYIQISLVENVGTVTDGTNTINLTNIGDIYHISDTGDYSMKKSNESAYMNGDSQIFNRGMTKVNSHYVAFVVSGSVNDGATITASNVTMDNIKMNSTPVNGYVDLYKFDSVTFDATYTGESGVTPVTYSYVVVPYEVTADKVIHPDGPTTAILNMLPIIIGAGLLLGAIAFMIVTRK